MKNVIVTGATSMLGVSLIKKCINENINVLAITRENSKNLHRIPQSDLIKIKECNLDQIHNLDIHETYDIFYHFGWDYTNRENRNNKNLQDKNIQYSLDAVKLAYKTKCSKFIGAGSQAEYGPKSEKISPNTECNPVIAYGYAKNKAYKETLKLCKEYNIIHIWPRIFSVYGINDKDHTMISQTILSLLNFEKPKFTPSEQLWDYLFSEDAGLAFYLIGKHIIKNEVYCIGSGETHLLKDYIYKIRDEINPNLELGIGELEYNKNQVMYLCADISNLQKDTGFKPNFSFKEGIKLTIDYLRNKKLETQ